MVFRRGTRRRRKVALLGGACLLGLGIVAWLAWPRDEPSRATVADAVRSFRAESAPSKDGEGSDEPALGVYRYGTRGSESVDSPVLGTTHDYNGVSTVVLSPGRCAERERWQVLDGRWTEAELCPSHGKTTGTVTEFHEFFGVSKTDSFRCRGDGASARSGARFASSCRSEDSSISTTSRVRRDEKIQVGGVVYDSVLVDSRSRLAGATSGTAERREWRRRSDGLLLRRSVQSDTDLSTAGGAHYSEHYTIKLLSVDPKR